MPELPEVELVRHHLEPLLKGRKAGEVRVFKPRLIRPNTPAQIQEAFQDVKFQAVERHGKYLLFNLQKISGSKEKRVVLGHLGMTGRMYLQPAKVTLPKHAVIAISLGRDRFVFEDARGFGRFNLELDAIKALGPEPMSKDFSLEYFQKGLARSSQPIKVKLLDQSLVAGVGNIYASEALFHAEISPVTPCNKLSQSRIDKLRISINKVLTDAIKLGKKLPLDFAGNQGGESDAFYYGVGESSGKKQLKERFTVYDREGQPCVRCGRLVERIEQGGRSSYYCVDCQGF